MLVGLIFLIGYYADMSQTEMDIYLMPVVYLAGLYGLACDHPGCRGDGSQIARHRPFGLDDSVGPGAAVSVRLLLLVYLHQRGHAGAQPVRPRSETRRVDARLRVGGALRG